MKTNVHFWSYLAEFFLELEVFKTNSEEEIKYILYSITVFSKKKCRLWDNVEK